MALDVPLSGEGFEALASQVGNAVSGRGAVLLVLDNFEQVVAHAQSTLSRWLKTAPEASFLVTSRSILRIEGEQVFALEPLPEVDGVQLFEMRSRAAGATWGQDQQTRDAIGAIVTAVDGLPLAIELAAARAVLLSPTQLLERLSERFKLLRGGRRGTTDRQSTLRDLIRWSWDLLEPWEQEAMAQLSVFREGFFMEAAEDVVDLSTWPDSPWLLDVVGSLLDKSLLRRWTVQGRPRFGMYASIQEYAAQKLGSEAVGAGIRHARYFASFGTEAFLESLDSHGGVDRRKLLAMELENFLVAVDCSVQAGDGETAAGCALAASDVFQLQGPYSDGLALLGRVADNAMSGETQERLSRHLGSLLHLSGGFDEALIRFNQALKTAGGVGNRRGEGITLGQVAWLHRERGRAAKALECGQQALAIAREEGDRRTQGTTLGNLGLLHYEQGRLTEAVEHYQEALVIAQEVGNQRHEGVTLGNLALLHQEKGLLAEALGYFQQALSVARRVGNRRGEGVTLGNMAHIHRNQGHIPEALAHYRQALSVAREVGNTRSEGVTLGNLGDFLFSQGEVVAAESHLRDAISISDESYPIAAGAFRGSLALICGQRGQLEEALVLLECGEPQVRGVYRMELGKFLCKKAQVESLAGDSDAAQATLAEAQEIASEMGVLPGSQLGQALEQARGVVSC